MSFNVQKVVIKLKDLYNWVTLPSNEWCSALNNSAKILKTIYSQHTTADARKKLSAQEKALNKFDLSFK